MGPTTTQLFEQVAFTPRGIPAPPRRFGPLSRGFPGTAPTRTSPTWSWPPATTGACGPGQAGRAGREVAVVDPALRPGVRVRREPPPRRRTSAPPPAGPGASAWSGRQRAWCARPWSRDRTASSRAPRRGSCLTTSRARPGSCGPNGTVATTLTADEPDTLRGPSFDWMWLEEINIRRHDHHYFHAWVVQDHAHWPSLPASRVRWAERLARPRSACPVRGLAPAAFRVAIGISRFIGTLLPRGSIRRCWTHAGAGRAGSQAAAHRRSHGEQKVVASLKAGRMDEVRWALEHDGSLGADFKARRGPAPGRGRAEASEVQAGVSTCPLTCGMSTHASRAWSSAPSRSACGRPSSGTTTSGWRARIRCRPSTRR